jgi:dienelactone hydrolase
MRRTNIEFEVEAGLTLRGWLFTPEGDAGPHPAVTMAHGYGGVKEFGLERFARAFAEAGFVVLVHDHRNFGASDGEPRGDIDPWRQIGDWRRAISFLESLPEVEATRMGLWGTSYAGGHAIVLGASDRPLLHCRASAHHQRIRTGTSAHSTRCHRSARRDLQR